LLLDLPALAGSKQIHIFLELVILKNTCQAELLLVLWLLQASVPMSCHVLGSTTRGRTTL